MVPWRACGYLLVATDGSSISQGHAAIVFTLLPLFLITVIFMTSLLGTPGAPLPDA
jgi:hypothetical protein